LLGRNQQITLAICKLCLHLCFFRRRGCTGLYLGFDLAKIFFREIYVCNLVLLVAKGEYEKAAKEAESGDPAAKAEAAKAKAAMDSAETKYKTGSKTEREKIAKAFPCGDVKLATNRGTKSPSNGKAVGEACKTLLSANDVEVTMTFTLDRYELPVALVYNLAGKFTWSPVASVPLMKMDPR